MAGVAATQWLLAVLAFALGDEPVWLVVSALAFTAAAVLAVREDRRRDRQA